MFSDGKLCKWLTNQCSQFNVYLYAVACSVNLVMITGGSAFGWTSPVIPKLESNTSSNPLPEPITKLEESWVTALLHLGAATGPLLAGYCAHRFGRKRTLLVFSLALIIPDLTLAFGRSVIIYSVARFVLGIGLGTCFTVIPMYIGEIAENSNRGFLGCLMMTCGCLGMVMCFSIGPYTSVLILSIINAIPAVLFLILYGMFAPESPYYLIGINDNVGAEKALSKIRKKDADIQKELLEIEQDVEKYKQMNGGFRDLLNSRNGMKALAICAGSMFFQQFAGVTAVTGYMQPIFEASGTKIPGNISTVVIGLVQIIVAIVGSQLVDRLGRRVLFLGSSVGTLISLVALGTFFYLKNRSFDVESLFWLPITSLVVYMIAYGIGIGTLPWTIMGEMFPTNIKPLCSTITAMTCNFLAFLIAVFFPNLVLLLGMAETFWFFAVFTAFSILFFAVLLPETKGRSLEEIQALLGRRD